MSTVPASPATDIPPAKFGWVRITLFLLATVILTTALTVWIIKVFLFPSAFKPVILGEQEEKVLNAKLERLESFGYFSDSAGSVPGKSKRLEPEAYTEVGASREVSFTERELNAMVAKNIDLAEKLAIDLSDNLVSMKLLVPVDADFPMFGGQTLKVKAGVEMIYQNKRPIVVLKGISVMGVPLPNAWMGGMKNIDLVKEFGAEKGFWKSFADGVEHVQVKQGRLNIKLKE